ncbi:MAG: hypothetical protein ACSLFI_03195 [Solirubrobacterales bacterium]
MKQVTERFDSVNEPGTRRENDEAASTAKTTPGLRPLIRSM